MQTFFTKFLNFFITTFSKNLQPVSTELHCKGTTIFLISKLFFTFFAKIFKLFYKCLIISYLETKIFCAVFYYVIYLYYNRKCNIFVA